MAPGRFPVAVLAGQDGEHVVSLGQRAVVPCGLGEP